jgi:predicted O-linked N-acetylglucosamine transferase (SPINDLY family)
VLRRLLADALIASGARAERAGRLEEACARYRAAARCAPRAASPRLNLGAALESLGDAEGAQRAYAAALGAEPRNPYANFNLGRLAFARRALEDAERHLRSSLDAQPGFAEALIALGSVLDARGRPEEAASALERALALAPLHAGAWYNYGELLWRLERYDQAEDALRRTLELEPRFIPAWHLLANLLRGLSRIAESLEALAAARRLEPARFDLESMELHALMLGDTLDARSLFERHRAFGARLEAAVRAGNIARAPSPDAERRLRLGYVSCDFNRHPVAWFALPLFERHDRARVEVFCYSTATRPADEVTAKVRAAADAWRDAGALGDEALAERIRGDGIDILVDLTGHVGALRLGVFARRPAPVQASWLGYLGTTGLARIDYRITDARADPPGETERLHTESLVRLPHCLWCYRPAHAAAHAAAPPCVRNGFATFGSFNHAPKLSASARRLWAEILRRAPRSRLVVVGMPEGRAREGLLRDFAAAGVDPARLAILPRVPFDEYLRQFDAVDVALDSLPYGGGTTTFDALWMGVPVLTLAGERSVSRSAASIVGALGLEDWVAASPEEFVRVALAHSADAARLGGLRAGLRARLRASPLMDEAGFARDMEDAYRAMWRAWCERRLA